MGGASVGGLGDGYFFVGVGVGFGIVHLVGSGQLEQDPMLVEAIVDSASLLELVPIKKHLDVTVGGTDLVIDPHLVSGHVDGEMGTEKFLDLEIVPVEVHGRLGIFIKRHGPSDGNDIVQNGLTNNRLHHGMIRPNPILPDGSGGVVCPPLIGVILVVGGAINEAGRGKWGEADVEEYPVEVGIGANIVHNVPVGEEVGGIGTHFLDPLIPHRLILHPLGLGQFMRQTAKGVGHLDKLAHRKHWHQQPIKLLLEPLGGLDADIVRLVEHIRLIRGGHLPNGQ